MERAEESDQPTSDGIDRSGGGLLRTQQEQNTRNEKELGSDSALAALEAEEEDVDASPPPSPEPLEIPSTPPEEENESFSRRIYVLGAGSLGCFIAHSLRGIINSPPVTLLLHSRLNMYEWERKGQAIRLTTNKRTERRTGIAAERIPDLRNPETVMAKEFEDQEPIYNLIVTVKSMNTVGALKGVKHRLGPDSTICFLQNGMGAIDEVNEQVFPDHESRPRYLVGVVSHGLFTAEKFHVEHRGKGTIALSVLPSKVPVNAAASSSLTASDQDSPISYPSPPASERRPMWNTSSRYLMRTLTRTSVLSALGIRPSDLLTFQLEKLAVNCIVNPLTAIYDVRNGDLGVNRAMRSLMRLLLAEVSLVLRSLPEVKALGTQASNRFSPEKLEYHVMRVIKVTAANKSSTWQDVDAGKATEMGYLNGYIVKRGDELGIKCILNYMICQMVEARRTLIARKRTGLLAGEEFKKLDDAAKARLTGR